MQGLVAGLPPLEAMLATGAVHPFTLYLALCGLIGQIAAFGARTIPPVLGRYDHNNCVLAFGEIRDYVGRILDRVAETFIAIPFVFDNGKFGLTLEEPWATRKLIIGVRGPSNQSESVVAGWVENSLIASREQIDKLWEMRVMGAARKLVDTEGELPVSPARGTVLFEIDNDPSYITPGQTLEIWNADSRTNRYRPIDIVLYVRAGTGAAR